MKNTHHQQNPKELDKVPVDETMVPEETPAAPSDETAVNTVTNDTAASISSPVSVDKLQGSRIKCAIIDEWHPSADAREDVTPTPEDNFAAPGDETKENFALPEGTANPVLSTDPNDLKIINGGEEPTADDTEKTFDPLSGNPDNQFITGVVSKCTRLNVRSEPSLKAMVLTVIGCSDEVAVDTDFSNSEWYKVRTANGTDGFCMKKFIKVY